MGNDHASPEYLDGLSDLDRARAIVAVRWDNAEWVVVLVTPKQGGAPFRERCLTTHCTPIADPSLPITDLGLSPRYASWGTSWHGTASLMELAESKGWILANTDTSTLVPRYQFGSTVILSKPFNSNQIETKGDTIHAAALLACAAAAMRENTDGK